MYIVLGILGVLFIAYYIVIQIYAGAFLSFSWFWLVLGILCIVFAVLLRLELVYPAWKRSLLWVKVCITTTCAAGLVIFLITEGLIVAEIFDPPRRNLDYIVVLGAKMTGNQATPVMEHCVDAAARYLEQNPDTRIVVTGNRSADHPDITQADLLKDRLVELGVEEDRIILEPDSINLNQNLFYSYKLIGREWEGDGDPSVGVVTMNFNCFRARAFAAKEGYQVETIPSSADYLLMLHNGTKEFFAVIRDKLFGII
ncbi:MAG: YdcF family protein [Lachnospiraceae bacterium]|nr:YdcF family protein [Lachnospiraceae bacterium]